MPTIADLAELLIRPSEALTVEYKSWLDLSENPDRARLAKAAIALANEGGGIVVFGMREASDRTGVLRSLTRPDSISRYSLDQVNAAVSRFTDHRFHCELQFALHPTTNAEHAFVIVPGGHTVPIFSSRACDSIIAQRRCYVRKPGPMSEEPVTAQEWNRLLERCMRARRSDMLDAIRVIVQGHSDGPSNPAAENALNDFVTEAKSRWQSLVAALPDDSPARMPNGHYELAFEVVGVEPAPSLTELRQFLNQARQIRHTGWGPFVSLNRDPHSERPVDGNVEVWLGQQSEDRMFYDAAHTDFWRASPSGKLFLQRGYDEDAADQVEPGKLLDYTMPIWRVGEAMLFASRFSRAFGSDNPQIIVWCTYTGLAGRQLGRIDHRQYRPIHRWCADPSVRRDTTATAVEMEDNLVEILHALLSPLYERFDFYNLTVDTVRSELQSMRRHRF